MPLVVSQSERLFGAEQSAERLRVSVPHSVPGTGSDPEFELVPLWLSVYDPGPGVVCQRIHRRAVLSMRKALEATLDVLLSDCGGGVPSVGRPLLGTDGRALVLHGGEQPMRLEPGAVPSGPSGELDRPEQRLFVPRRSVYERRGLLL